MSGGAKFVVYAILAFFTIVFLGPILFIFINSFKSKFAISSDPFSLPIGETWVGFENFLVGLTKQGFLEATLWSFVITILSVIVIVFFSAMTAYYITRVKTWWTNLLYYLFVVSMIIPFQMVMFPTVKIADMLHLNNPIGIVVLYLGFGSGLSVFMFAGFVKSIPLDVEEAAMIDGCGPLQNGLSTRYKTIPVVIQSFVGSNGNRDMGAMMAMLVLAIIPIVIFYFSTQKHIIEGVAAGAVKG